MAQGDTGESALSFRVTPEGGLQAVFAPAAGRSVPKSGELDAAIAQAGFGDWFLSSDALGELARRLEVAPTAFTLQIGERRDASYALNLSEDYLAATVSITPARGGRHITREEILEALAREGVVFGIDEAAIEAAVAAKSADRFVVAAGVAPVPGEDSQFVSLLPEGKRELPQPDELGTVDYRNLGQLVSVSLGDPLMRRTRPTKGLPGMNLIGVELPSSDGCELPFADGLTGVACDLKDQDMLIAACSGFPAAVPRGIIVEPVLQLKRVDLSTGNLNVKGSLEIAGDVCEGMEVCATENITVGGIVEAAKVEAGGDIEVKGGVIGHGKLSLAKSEARFETAQVKAGGRVCVQFAENANIRAGGEIVVRELAMQSELTSGSQIRVGEPGGRKGHIIGGLCRAAQLVHAIVVGSLAGVPTVIEVGVDPSLAQRLGFVQETLEEKQVRNEELTKTLAYVNENPGSMEPGLRQLKERVYAKLQGEIAELLGEKKRLQKRMEVNAQARVRVERDVFLGVQIRIGSATLQVEDDLLSPTFTLGESGVEYSS